MPVLHRRPTLHEVSSRREVTPRLLRRRARAGAAAALGDAATGVAVLAGAVLAVTLVLLLVTVAAPLGAVLFAWVAWRLDRQPPGALARLRARWGRSARVIPGGA